MKKKAVSSPGSIPAINNLAMDCSVIMPKIISVTLGGRSTPRVPTLATIPVDSFLA
ncbi:MAG: hypothetical protein A4E57_02761 [Syntrophorhabdaceae bacterium PtaU1.Bin034]|nr:MAG: hypothetical protein A4E57_02761 [Syntrophorhabdaceae bacterium PtaU1.Bin034]